MKYISYLVSSTLILLSIACGSGSSNPVEAKKTELEGLKKQALDINAKIAALEADIQKLGGAETVKEIFVAVKPVATESFTHYIELQGKVESESVSYVTPLSLIHI